MRIQCDLRMDLANPFCHNFRFGTADSSRQSYRLTIDIGDVHNIFVNQSQCPQTSAGQGLRGMAPDTAKPKNCGVRMMEALLSIFTNQTDGAGKNLVV